MPRRSSKTRTSKSLARQSTQIHSRLKWIILTTVVLVCLSSYLLSLAFYYNGRFFRQAITPKIQTPQGGEIYFNRQIYGLGAFTAEKSFIKWGEQSWLDELYLTHVSFLTSPWDYLLAQSKLIAKSAIEAEKVTITFKPQFSYNLATSNNYTAQESILFNLFNKYFQASELVSQEHSINIPNELRLLGEDFNLKRLSQGKVQVKLNNTNFHLHKNRHLAAKINSISGLLTQHTLDANIDAFSFNNDTDSSINANINLNLSNQEALIQSEIKTTSIAFITKSKSDTAWLQGSLSLAQAKTNVKYSGDSIKSSTDLHWQDNQNIILQSRGLKLIESKLVNQSFKKNLAKCSGYIYKSPTELKGAITNYQSNYDYRIVGDWHLDYTKHANGALSGTMQLGIPRRDAKRILTSEAYQNSSIDKDNAYRWVTFELSGFLHNAQDNIQTLIKP
mgnify:CR=1 FL=1